MFLIWGGLFAGFSSRRRQAAGTTRQAPNPKPSRPAEQTCEWQLDGAQDIVHVIARTTDDRPNETGVELTLLRSTRDHHGEESAQYRLLVVLVNHRLAQILLPFGRFRDFCLLISCIPPGTLDRPATVLLDDSLELFKSKLPVAIRNVRATRSIKRSGNDKESKHLFATRGSDSDEQTLGLRGRRRVCLKGKWWNIILLPSC